MKPKTNKGKIETSNSAQAPVEDAAVYATRLRVYAPALSKLQQVDFCCLWCFTRNHHTVVPDVNPRGETLGLLIKRRFRGFILIAQDRKLRKKKTKTSSFNNLKGETKVSDRIRIWMGPERHRDTEDKLPPHVTAGPEVD